jgi:hypothetical protein
MQERPFLNSLWCSSNFFLGGGLKTLQQVFNESTRLQFVEFCLSPFSDNGKTISPFRYSGIYLFHWSVATYLSAVFTQFWIYFVFAQCFTILYFTKVFFNSWIVDLIGVLGFDSRRGPGIFLFTTASRTALRPTQPPIQWVQGALSLGIKRPGHEADHSPPSSAEVKECMELYLHSPIRLHGVVLS